MVTKPKPLCRAMSTYGKEWWLYIGKGRNRGGKLVTEWLGHCDFCGTVKIVGPGPFDNLICEGCADSFCVEEFGHSPNRLLPVKYGNRS